MNDTADRKAEHIEQLLIVMSSKHINPLTNLADRIYRRN